MYSPDKPIKTSEADKIGRKIFSQQLANAIYEFPVGDTFVVGLYGAWGSGKTSIINMTKEYLDNPPKDICDQDIIVVPFNPWNFTSCNQLIDQFFKTILAKLDCKDKTEKQKAIGDALKKYSSVFELAEYIPVVGPYLKILSRAIEGAGEHIFENAEAKENNIFLQKENVIVALEDYPGKIVVIIDDIDRLPNDQIRLIFQLVTSVADFPHMIYLLSFDKKVVANALRDTQQCDGDEYLEKVIQVPFETPSISRAMVHEILINKINGLLSNVNDDTMESKHWNRVFKSCISPFIKNLRDINRFINALRFKYPPLSSDINFTDLAGITALQVFAPQIFAWIKDNEFSLVGGVHNQGIVIVQQNAEKSKYLEKFQQIYPSSSEQMLSAITSLFPRIDQSVNYPYDDTNDKKLRKNLSIAHPKYFESYFSLSLGNITISQQELKSSIHKMRYNDLELYFKSLNADGRFFEYLDAFESNIETIPLDRIPLFIKLLFSYNDYSADNNENRPISWPLLHIGVIFMRLLLRIEDEIARKDFYIKLIQESTLRDFLTNSPMINSMELALGRLAANGSPAAYEIRAFSKESIEDIERAYIKKITSHSSEMNLLESDAYAMPIYLWKCFDIASYNRYLVSLLTNPANILLYINSTRENMMNDKGELTFKFNLDEEYRNSAFLDSTLSNILCSIKDETFFSLPENVRVSCAGFFLIYSQDDSNSKKEIRLEEALDQLALWTESRQ